VFFDPFFSPPFFEATHLKAFWRGFLLPDIFTLFKVAPLCFFLRAGPFVLRLSVTLLNGTPNFWVFFRSFYCTGKDPPNSWKYPGRCLWFPSRESFRVDETVAGFFFETPSSIRLNLSFPFIHSSRQERFSRGHPSSWVHPRPRVTFSHLKKKTHERCRVGRWLDLSVPWPHAEFFGLAFFENPHPPRAQSEGIPNRLSLFPPRTTR